MSKLSDHPRVGIGHNLTEREIWHRIQTHWDLIGLIPLPKFHIHCPICHSHEVIIHNMAFGKRFTSPHPFRCDVGFKCTQCSTTWTAGVVIPEHMWKWHHDRGTFVYHWRELRELVKENWEYLKKGY